LTELSLQALFAQAGLTDGPHTIVLTNDGGSDSGRPYVDIDFVTWTSNEEVYDLHPFCPTLC
jgi:hypothetical protein